MVEKSWVISYEGEINCYLTPTGLRIFRYYSQVNVGHKSPKLLCAPFLAPWKVFINFFWLISSQIIHIRYLGPIIVLSVTLRARAFLYSRSTYFTKFWGLIAVFWLITPSSLIFVSKNEFSIVQNPYIESKVFLL